MLCSDLSLHFHYTALLQGLCVLKGFKLVYTKHYTAVMCVLSNSVLSNSNTSIIVSEHYTAVIWVCVWVKEFRVFFALVNTKPLHSHHKGLCVSSSNCFKTLHSHSEGLCVSYMCVVMHHTTTANTARLFRVK